MNLYDSSILKLYALTPVHVGSGSSVGIVDLPIMRERTTNYPVIPSSGMKGAMRAHFDRYKDTKIAGKEQIAQFGKLTEQIFGTSEGDGGYAGSLSVSDAKLLAFPMRSNHAPFVHITCPTILKRFSKDLKITNHSLKVEELVIGENKAICVKGDLSGKVLLEDYVVEATNQKYNFGSFFEDLDTLLIVSDSVFDYAVQCTQITAQIKIDQETGTTANGSLRYQEELPADSLMYSLVFWGDSHGAVELKNKTIKDYVKDKVVNDIIQIGGDSTCGRGFFELKWMEAQNG
ncbi:MAG: type III-B CRISPR module RAMP protein Cmr4 [Fibromonadales bacterium]|nr:type III-B CRISPR module RAMP protein Cmr4 [Fibromonadales bacterium]